ncbi:MAG: ribosome silencing factor [Flavobacteriales bacterium]|nr:ribosome silencing factor [Flavobacteriales bacterium]MBL4734812.1 ribosome silencing factor [Flavobacteriales bacterium]PCH88442.1 MAG: ribosome silencing factor [Flavobacteriales bacterium]
MIKKSFVKSKTSTSGKDSSNLVDIIINSILEKKGNDLVSLDLRKTEGAICDNFIICHGNSNTQVRAIADFIIEEVKKLSGSNPWKKEGFENMQWILIDYVDIVVHVFQAEARAFYDVEGMWADADVTSYNEKRKAV